MAVNDYLTVAEAKAALPDFKWASVTAYDPLITGLITAASRAVDRFVDKKPGSFYVNADVTRYYDAPRNDQDYPLVNGGLYDRASTHPQQIIGLWIDELAAAPTSVAVAMTGDLTNYTTWPASDYMLWPYNAADEGEPYRRLDLDILYGSHASWYGYRRGVKIVGKFGFSTTVPADVKQVVTEEVIRWFKLAQVNYQDHGNVGNASLEDTRFYGERYRNIEADLANLIMHYRGIIV